MIKSGCFLVPEGAVSRYFPAKVTKTIELNEGPYLFACHPHGVVGVGTFLTFGLDFFGFRKEFPELESAVVLLGLDKNFKIPFFREFLLLLGLGTCGKRTILSIFTTI